MMPAELIAHEALARLANPVLMRFLPAVPRQSEEWSAAMVDRLVDRCGAGTPHLWRIRLTREEAPALLGRLTTGGLRVGDLLRSPQGRERSLEAVALALLRDGTSVIAPDDDAVLNLDDQLLLAGGRRALDATLTNEPTAAYVVDGEFAPSSWIWRRLSRGSSAAPKEHV